MKASEMIEELRTLILEWGDLEVVNDENETVGLEHNDDAADPVFVFVIA